jgi:hypothetical protein
MSKTERAALVERLRAIAEAVYTGRSGETYDDLCTLADEISAPVPRDETKPAPNWVRHEKDGVVGYRRSQAEVFSTQATWFEFDREHNEALRRGRHGD